MDLGKLKQVPVRTLDYAAIWRMIEIQLTCPVGMDPRHPNCEVSFGFCLRLSNFLELTLYSIFHLLRKGKVARRIPDSGVGIL
jgi:hypothetical protein